MQPKILTCASYYGTGSSAVIDFASEFSSVKSLGNAEIRFLHDPDGIDDLEFHLVENHNRHNAGHAIKRFLRMAKRLNGSFFKKEYSDFFNGKWMDATNDYINDLTEFSFNGWWHYDFYNHGALYHLRKRLPNKLLHLTLWRNSPERNLNLMKNEIAYCAAPSEEEFIQKTKAYLERLFNEEIRDDYNALAIDQIVPPSNIERYSRYFDDIRAVVVERDPRDVYTLEKMYWNAGIIPSDTPESFSEWFKYTRNHRKSEAYNPATTLFIYFEDLIYRYEDTTEKLMTFYNLNPNDHAEKKKYLNPDVSINNTRTWLKHPELADDIAVIERELSEYLYDYKSIGLE